MFCAAKIIKKVKIEKREVKSKVKLAERGRKFFSTLRTLITENFLLNGEDRENRDDREFREFKEFREEYH